MGPGYYSNHDDIKSIKKEFESILNKNRQKGSTLRRASNPSGGGFGSSTTRDEGSTHQKAIAESYWNGKIGDNYQGIKESSVIKKTFNTNIAKSSKKNMQANMVIN